MSLSFQSPTAFPGAPTNAKDCRTKEEMVAFAFAQIVKNRQSLIMKRHKARRNSATAFSAANNAANAVLLPELAAFIAQTFPQSTITGPASVDVTDARAVAASWIGEGIRSLMKKGVVENTNAGLENVAPVFVFTGGENTNAAAVAGFAAMSSSSKKNSGGKKLEFKSRLKKQKADAVAAIEAGTGMQLKSDSQTSKINKKDAKKNARKASSINKKIKKIRMINSHLSGKRKGSKK